MVLAMPASSVLAPCSPDCPLSKKGGGRPGIAPRQADEFSTWCSLCSVLHAPVHSASPNMAALSRLTDSPKDLPVNLQTEAPKVVHTAPISGYGASLLRVQSAPALGYGLLQVRVAHGFVAVPAVCLWRSWELHCALRTAQSNHLASLFGRNKNPPPPAGSARSPKHK